MSLYRAIKTYDKAKFNVLIEITDVNKTGTTCNETILYTAIVSLYWDKLKDFYFLKRVLEKGADVNYLRWPESNYNKQTYIDTAMVYFPRNKILPEILSLLVKYGLTYETLMAMRETNIKSSSLCETMHAKMLRYFKLFPFLVAGKKFCNSLKYVIYSFL